MIPARTIPARTLKPALAAAPAPAAPLAAAVYDARRAAQEAGRVLLAVASVVGTEHDPQGLDRQIATLESAGVEVMPSNAQAARFAALLTRPELEATLLGETR